MALLLRAHHLSEILDLTIQSLPVSTDIGIDMFSNIHQRKAQCTCRVIKLIFGMRVIKLIFGMKIT